jgi:hypothetical protein
LNGSSRSQESLVSWRILRFSNGQSGSGSVGLPRAPSWPLCRRRPGLQGFPLVSAFRRRSVGKTAFMILLSSSERSRKRWNRLSLVPPLMGFECRPPTGTPHMRPLPEAEAPFGPTLPSADSCSALVVSHHLDGLLRT